MCTLRHCYHAYAGKSDFKEYKTKLDDNQLEKQQADEDMLDKGPGIALEQQL